MELIGQKREILGKKVKNLRAERQIPAVIFGKGIESLSISVDYVDFLKIFDAAGETSVIDLMVENKKHPVLVKEIQEHHISGEPIHVGFYEVDLTQKVNANIPVEVINDEENPLVKSGEAMVLAMFDEIEVEALPNDLPEKFIVDAMRLVDMDSIITPADLEFDREKVEITGVEEDEIVAKLDYAQMLEEEEEEEEVDEAEMIAGLEATEETAEDDDATNEESAEDSE